jgi:hypothetical protein
MKWRWTQLFGDPSRLGARSDTTQPPTTAGHAASVEYPREVRKNRRFVPAAIRAAVVTEKPGDFIFDPDSGR